MPPRHGFHAQVYEGYYIPAPDALNRELGLWVQSAGRYQASNHVCRTRVRDDYLLLYCARGRGILQVADAVHPIEGGMLFGLLPGIPHAYWSDVEEGWDIHYAHYAGSLAETLTRQCGFGARRPVLLVKQEEGLLSCYRRLCSVLERKSPRCDPDATTAMFALLMETRQLSAGTGAGQDWFRRAVDSGAEDLDDMAAAAGMSRFHFCRAFREAAGVPPWRYVLERRLTRAKEMLVGTGLSVKEIAAELGFRDANYFSRLFAREAGISARAFRREHREQTQAGHAAR